MSTVNHDLNGTGSLLDDWDSVWDLNTGIPIAMPAMQPPPPTVFGVAGVSGAAASGTSSDLIAAPAGTPSLSQGGFESVYETSGNLTINIEFDSAAQAAPAAFRSEIESAASMIAAAMSVQNACTINLEVQYNEDGIAAGSADAGPESGQYISYSTVRSDLIADAPAGDPNFNALPTGTIDNGYSQVVVWNAELKALGLLAGNSAAIDGIANFSSTIPADLQVGVALHELCHAMGRVPAGGTPDVFELTRFSSPGTIVVDDSIPAVSASYFSVNGGVTKLADYGIYSDPSDFLNSFAVGSDAASPLTPEDAFNQYYDSSTKQTLTAVDLTQMDVLGFGTFTCYCPGTLIMTDRGEVAVEDLRAGMLIVTAAGQRRPVRWIGWRRVDFTRHPDPAGVRPIRILAGAFGHGVPRNDLLLSPDHAVFIDGVLIPVKLLVNGTTIRREATCGSTTYYHVELDSHDVLLAEGLPAESYLDTGNRNTFENATGVVTPHPGFVARQWECEGCAPMVVTGPRLRAARRRLEALAAGVTAAAHESPTSRTARAA
jgi:hypothetical protein